MSLLGALAGAAGGVGEQMIDVGTGTLEQRRKEAILKMQQEFQTSERVAGEKFTASQNEANNQAAMDRQTSANDAAAARQTEQISATRALEELRLAQAALAKNVEKANEVKVGYNEERKQWEEYTVVNGEPQWSGVRTKNPEGTSSSQRRYLDPELDAKVKGLQGRIKVIQDSDTLGTEEKLAQIAAIEKQIDVLLGYGLPTKRDPVSNPDPNKPASATAEEKSAFEKRANNVAGHSAGLLEMSSNPPLPTDRKGHGNLTQQQAIIEATRVIELEMGVPFNPQDPRQGQFLSTNYPELWEAVTKP